jgi:glutaminase
MDYGTALAGIYEEVRGGKPEGQVASYIPELALVDAGQFGIHLLTVEGEEFSCGDSDRKFSIQSISKVLSLAQALSLVGEKLWERVDVEPSGNAFNSIVQLESEKGIPRNPLINAGALVVADILASYSRRPGLDFLSLVRKMAGNEEIHFNDNVAASERAHGFLNAAIANLIKSFGNLENDIEQVLSFYYHQCSVEMSCRDLSRAFLAFADHTKGFQHGPTRLTQSQVKRINAIMQTCGFYDQAGEFSFRVGLPGKSGVGGGIVAVFPGKYTVAVWSPRLNDRGNSVMGMKTLELLTTRTGTSIF